MGRLAPECRHEEKTAHPHPGVGARVRGGLGERGPRMLLGGGRVSAESWVGPGLWGTVRISTGDSRAAYSLGKQVHLAIIPFHRWVDCGAVLPGMGLCQGGCLSSGASGDKMVWRLRASPQGGALSSGGPASGGEGGRQLGLEMQSARKVPVVVEGCRTSWPGMWAGTTVVLRCV